MARLRSTAFVIVVLVTACLAARPALAADVELPRVKQAVFEIESGRGAGTAFLVDKSKRLLATAAHVVMGAQSATARREGTEPRVPVDVVCVDVALDLAVLRMPEAGWSTQQIEALSVANAPPASGDHVWAFGFRFGASCNVYEGVVTAVLSPKERDHEFGFIGIGDAATVIQTDCTLNHGLSGGPMVNADGVVVGVNHAATPDYVHEQRLYNAYLAVDARHLRAMLATLDAHATVPWSKVAKLRATPHEQRNDPSLPAPPVASGLGDAASLLALVNPLDNSGLCRVCGGDGWATRRGKEGDHAVPFAKPSIREQLVQCNACDGTGFANAKSLRKRLAAVVGALANLAPSDPRRGAVLERCGDVLRKLFAANPESMRRILMATGATGIPRSTPAGTPVVLCGTFDERSWQKGREVIYVRISGERRASATVAILEPSFADGKVGEEVLIGGRLDEWVEVKGLIGDIPALSRGFVVAAPAPKGEPRGPRSGS